jgi:hypothetical protein
MVKQKTAQTPSFIIMSVIQYQNTSLHGRPSKEEAIHCVSSEKSLLMAMTAQMLKKLGTIRSRQLIRCVQQISMNGEQVRALLQVIQSTTPR